MSGRENVNFYGCILRQGMETRKAPLMYIFPKKVAVRSPANPKSPLADNSIVNSFFVRPSLISGTANALGPKYFGAIYVGNDPRSSGVWANIIIAETIIKNNIFVKKSLQW